MFETRPESVILSSHTDDIPTLKPGMLIPQSVAVVRVTPIRRRRNYTQWLSLIMMFVCVGLVANLSFSAISGSSQRATPVVTIYNPQTNVLTPLPWGSHQALMQPSFFLETRDTFIEQGISFIEVDLTALQLRYFETGVLRLSVPVVSKGSPGSWWETPAGIYETTHKEAERFSTTAQTIQPWSINFATNYVIHGEPLYPDKQPVPPERAEGGIRLTTLDAEKLFTLVDIGTPVLVHDRPRESRPLLYDAPLPDVVATGYLVADRETGTILAGKGVDDVLPVASITKLMTALVAAEQLDLDDQVTMSDTSFVTSIIPRLSGRSTVSVYSLLQLLLVESSNEAATVIASQMPGQTFIDAMNEKARALGMTNTAFVDASGLSAGNQSTPFDLFLLMQHIAEQRSFILDLTTTGTVSTSVVAGEFNDLVNFNNTSNTLGFRGGKVGETLAAGQTSVSLHEFPAGDETREVVIVVLGTDTRSADLAQLLAFTSERLR